MFHQDVGIGYKMMKNHQIKNQIIRAGELAGVAANPFSESGPFVVFFFFGFGCFDYNLVYTQDYVSLDVDES